MGHKECLWVASTRVTGYTVCTCDVRKVRAAYTRHQARLLLCCMLNHKCFDGIVASTVGAYDLVVQSLFVMGAARFGIACVDSTNSSVCMNTCTITHGYQMHDHLNPIQPQHTAKNMHA